MERPLDGVSCRDCGQRLSTAAQRIFTSAWDVSELQRRRLEMSAAMNSESSSHLEMSLDTRMAAEFVGCETTPFFSAAPCHAAMRLRVSCFVNEPLPKMDKRSRLLLAPKVDAHLRDAIVCADGYARRPIERSDISLVSTTLNISNTITS